MGREDRAEQLAQPIVPARAARPPRPRGRASAAARPRRRPPAAQTGSTTASGTGGSVGGGDPQRGPASRAALAANGSGRRRRPGGVARLVAGEHVEDRGGVGDRAREHAVDPERGVAQLRRRRRCARGSASGPPGRSTRRGCGSSRRRRCRGRPAPCRWRPQRPRRPRSRRACARRSQGLRVGPNSARLGDRQDAVLGQRGGAHDHEAGVLQAARDVVVVARTRGRPSASSRRSGAGPATGRLFLIAMGTPANGRSSPGRDPRRPLPAPARRRPARTR